MTRSCYTCEWGREHSSPSQGAHKDYLLCKEGPLEVLKAPADWCGRFRIAESLAGGRDGRRAGA